MMKSGSGGKGHGLRDTGQGVFWISFWRFVAPLVLLLVLCLFSSTSVTAAASPAVSPVVDLPRSEIMRLGEQMYRSGILPSGSPMPAFIRGDVEVDSSAFSCSSCHLRAGLGSYEGGVVTPPTTGSRLYKPYRRPPSLGDKQDQGGRTIYAKTVIERPAYTHETLAAAMRFGKDPAGQIFNDVMPRYPLSDYDMSILIQYLDALSLDYSPGAAKDELHFATIIADDVSDADRRALLAVLQEFIDKKNRQMNVYKDFIRTGFTPTADMKYAFHTVTLDVWELKGDPSGWQAQLAEYLRKKPVFAVLSGITNREWQPVHDFCEANRLPCLFPVTDFPVVSDAGWYTFYFNRGYVQEGGAVARYLHREGISPDTRILQVVQNSPAGNALAQGFRSAWRETGRPDLTSVSLTAEQIADQAFMEQLIKKHSPAVLLLWADPGALQMLPQLLSIPGGPGRVFVSSVYLGKESLAIPEGIRDRIYFTYPYRLTPYVGPKAGGYDSKIPVVARSAGIGSRRIGSRIRSMLQQVVLQGVNLIYDNLYRDHLLDVLSMQMDVTVEDYERFSFGPGQRFVSKGCYIIQLGRGKEPALLPRSEWVTH